MNTFKWKAGAISCIVVICLLTFFIFKMCSNQTTDKPNPEEDHCQEEELEAFTTFDSTYTTMQEAEHKLIQALKKHEQDYYIYNHELIDFVSKEPNTMTYPFYQLQQELDIDIVTSDDGNLRIYTWDTQRGGTMIIWGTIMQYRTKDTIYTIANDDVDLEGKIDRSDTVIIDTYVLDIHKIYDFHRQPIYLLYSVFPTSSMMGMYFISAIRIGENRLEPAYILLEEDGHYDYIISVEGNNNWKDVFLYDDTNLSVYVVDSIEVGNYYRHYHFDGERMQYIGMSKQ